MAKSCCHAKCCPPVTAESPYDEVSHEVANNVISIKVAKDVGRLQGIDENASGPGIDVNCTDARGKKCREDCTKVNVIANQPPPRKRPDEEMYLLRTVRQITANDDLKNTLEIEFKAPRNYVPLPDPGPTPPIIVPKRNVKAKKGKGTGKVKGKRGK